MSTFHSAPPPPAPTGHLVEPLGLSVSYRTGDTEVGFSVADRSPDDPYLYRRWGSPAGEDLAQRLARREGGAGAVLFSTGMAAIAGLFVHRLSQGDRLVLADICYPGVPELAHGTLARMGIEVTTVDPTNLDEVAVALATPARHVHIEVPANPVLSLSDITAISRLAHDAGAQLSVDATLGGSVGIRPLALGADWVVHSLTKYINGHGDALGGAVVGADPAALHALEDEGVVHLGAVLSPLDVHLIARGLATLDLRVPRQSESALQVARWLREHPRVRRVHHPLLEDHPQHDLVEPLGLRGSGMVSFVVDDPELVAGRGRRELSTIAWAVSLGHDRSLMYLISTDGLLSSSYRLSPVQEARYRALAGPALLRFSVGLEDPAALIADLEHILR